MGVRQLRWWVSNEPALGVAVAVALLALVLGFLLDLDGGQIAVVLALVVLGGGFLTRAMVYGPRTVDDVLDAEVVMTAPPARDDGSDDRVLDLDAGATLPAPSRSEHHG